MPSPKEVNKMNKKRLTEDLENMEQIMCKTADHVDIWQDRFIYAIARAIYDIILWILKRY